MITLVSDPEAAANAASSFVVRDKVRGSDDIHLIQDRVRVQAHNLGFEGESTRDLLLLALEEFGELAAAERYRSGLSVSQPRGNSLAEELSDTIILLIGIANRENIDLGDALIRKIAINNLRAWKAGGAHDQMSNS